MSSSSSPEKPMPTGRGIRKGRREQVTITIAPDILDRVDERAARMGLNRAVWINTCIFHGLEASFTVRICGTARGARAFSVDFNLRERCGHMSGL